MGRATGRARRPTRGRGKRGGRSLAGAEKSAHIGNVTPYATRRRPATPGRDGAVVVSRRTLPRRTWHDSNFVGEPSSRSPAFPESHHDNEPREDANHGIN